LWCHRQSHCRKYSFSSIKLQCHLYWCCLSLYICMYTCCHFIDIMILVRPKLTYFNSFVRLFRANMPLLTRDMNGELLFREGLPSYDWDVPYLCWDFPK
jgi:hypothetical protein